MKDFRKLSVWGKAHRVTLTVYHVTRVFPRDERYGLTAQIRRSAASVGANIAEGCGRGGGPEFARFLRIAFGSACELEYHLILAADLDLISRQGHAELGNALSEVKRMLAGLLRKLRVQKGEN